MATIVPTTDLIGSGNQLTVATTPALAPGGSLYILPDVSIISTDNTAISDVANIASYSMRIDGRVIGDNYGMYFTSSDNPDYRIIVGQTGVVHGTNSGEALYIAAGPDSTSGTFVLDNAGELSSGSDRAVYLSRFQEISVRNSGDITAADPSVFTASGLDLSNSEQVRVFNSGLISTAGQPSSITSGAIDEVAAVNMRLSPDGANFDLSNSGVLRGVYTIFSDADTSRVANSGLVDGNSWFDGGAGSTLDFINSGEVFGDIDLQSGTARMVNTGTIAGDISLGDGADDYQGFGDGVTTGAVLGNGGDDTIAGGSLADNLDGGTGSDLLVGRAGNDRLNGGSGNDLLVGNDGDDYADGGAGSDTVKGGAGEDELYGGTENDTVTGGANDDFLDGGSGLDVLDGGAGNDTMIGGLGNDLMRGRDGVDFLTGGQGLDVLTGGTGADVFVYVALSDSTADANRDVILDFEKGVDEINLFDVVPGPLSFRGTAGFTATGGPELRLQETQGGSTIVRVDADGNGTTDMEINVAQVQGLTADDFVL